MKIGEYLNTVATTEGWERGNAISIVTELIKDHKEYKMLNGFLTAAQQGRKEVCIGRCLAPLELESEGIAFKQNASGTAIVAYW